LIHSTLLTIGQVAFRLANPVEVLDPEPPPDPGAAHNEEPYAGFREPAVPDLPCLDIPVRIGTREPVSIPGPGPAGVIWNQGGWGLAVTGDGFHLWGPAGSVPLWEADLNPSFDRVELALSARYRCGGRGRPAFRNPLRYPLDQVLLLYALARREGCIVHAAGVVWDGRAFVFPGRSGAGKSTLARQFLARGRADLLSDDRVVLRRLDGRLWAFGTPWPGEAGIARNAGAPLGGIAFLRHAPEHRLAPVVRAEALARLLPATSIPWFHAQVLPHLLDFTGSVVSDVPSWELSFRPEAAVVEFLQERLAPGAD
jgi:hypothetical protein